MQACNPRTRKAKAGESAYVKILVLGMDSTGRKPTEKAQRSEYHGHACNFQHVRDWRIEFKVILDIKSSM